MGKREMNTREGSGFPHGSVTSAQDMEGGSGGGGGSGRRAALPSGPQPSRSQIRGHTRRPLAGLLSRAGRASRDSTSHHLTPGFPGPLCGRAPRKVREAGGAACGQAGAPHGWPHDGCSSVGRLEQDLGQRGTRGGEVIGCSE